MNFTDVTASGSGACAISPNLLSSLKVVNRQHFDPKKKEHLDSVKKFIETGNWGDVQFFCEFPFTDVPMSVLTQYTAFKLKANYKGRNDRIVNA